MSAIIKKSWGAEELFIDKYEVLHFLGYKKADVTQADLDMVEGYLPEAVSVIKPAACYSRFEVKLLENNKIQLPYGIVETKDLSRNLWGCREVYIFAATIGLAFDRLLQVSRLTSLAKASVLQSIGAVAVENVCDKLNEELKLAVEGEGRKVHPRYSAGYGDYALENQKGIFEVIDPSRQIGINLKENLIMVPEKSVTAIIGIE